MENIYILTHKKNICKGHIFEPKHYLYLNLLSSVASIPNRTYKPLTARPTEDLVQPPVVSHVGSKISRKGLKAQHAERLHAFVCWVRKSLSTHNTAASHQTHQAITGLYVSSALTKPNLWWSRLISGEQQAHHTALKHLLMVILQHLYVRTADKTLKRQIWKEEDNAGDARVASFDNNLNVRIWCSEQFGTVTSISSDLVRVSEVI